MDAGGSDSHQRVAGLDVLSGHKILLIRHANCEAGQVILILRIKAGHLCCLAADQSRVGLNTSFAYAAYDSGDLLGIVLAAGNIVQEIKRFAARAGDVIDAHSDAVNAYCIVLIHKKSDLELCAHAVCSG